MVRLDEAALEQKLEALERVRSWGPRVVSKLEGLLRVEDDVRLFRANALAFAAERGIDEAETVDLFLYATKLGIFTMEWQLICPQCTDAVETVHSLGSVGNTYHCSLCRKDLETSLDDLIQVTFTVSPALRRLRFHDPDTLDIEEFCFGYHFSAGTHGVDGSKWIEQMRPFLVMLGYVAPGEVRRFVTELHPGVLRGADRVHRAELSLPIRSGAPERSQFRLRLEAGQFLTDVQELSPGPTIIEIENAMAKRAAVMAINAGGERGFPRSALPRFLSGKQLFVTQTFSELFRSETVGRRGGLALKDLTFLFTDLKGSTELYDRIGDLKAFHLVDQHFEHLAAVIRRRRGAVVKTIGDAVMATFAAPQEAVSAAADMLHTIEGFNRERGARDVILKIGVHSGPSIAVTQNERLDYFGQTVNIAARVQALAEGDEICLTDPVMTAPGVGELFAGLEVSSRETQLRGVRRPLRVYRVRTP